MASINFIPLDYDYFDFQGRNYARIIGRDDKGKRVLVIDSFEPYIHAILKQDISEKQIETLIKKIEKIEIPSSGRTTKIDKIEIEEKNFLSKQVKALKIHITNFKDAHPVADKLDLPEIEARRGYDLSFHTKYIISKELIPLNWYRIEGEILNNSLEFGGIDSAYEVDICIKAEKIEKIKEQEKIKFKPKIIAFDIEADEFEIGKGEILMISLAGENYKKVLTWKQCPAKQDYVECFKDEEEMLEKFVEYTKKLSPDILAGYFSDGFDLQYLRARAQKHGIKLSLGLDNSQPVFARGRIPSASISGIVHIDLFRFIETVYSQYLQSETLGLDEVAKELLGEGKKEFEFRKSDKIKQHEWKDFFEYNLQDSVLTYKLAERFWPDMEEFCKIIQEPLFEITRDSMSSHVENYIIHHLEKYNEIPEKRPVHDEINSRRMRKKYEGAFVFEPTPGLYENLAFFDFTSMYGSIIVSHNLSKASFREKKDKNTIEIDLGKEGKSNKVYFSKEKSFFSDMLEEIIEKRKKYKQEYNKNPNNYAKARSNGYKLLANASYGYLGFFGARYYCVEAAASTAALARQFIQEVIDNVNKASFKAIYADSVDGKTNIFIMENGKIQEVRIEEIFNSIDKKSSLGKEYNFKEDIKVLTLDEKGKSVFKPMKYVMRHKCNKKMYRVNFTNNWHIDVTEDHSLLGYQSCHFNQSKNKKENPLRRIIEIKPEEIKKKANTIISLKKLPIRKQETKNFPREVYEFMGYFIGDGSFSRNKSHQKYDKDYYLRLSLGSDQQEIIKKIIEPLKKEGYIRNYWLSKTRKGDLTLNGLKLISLISEDFRDEKGKKNIPMWLFEEKEENIASFLRGLFSADGCVMIRNNAPTIKYTSIDEEYIGSVRKLLYRIGISHSTFKENSANKYKIKEKVFCGGTHSKNIIIKNKEDFVEKVGFILDRKNKLAGIKTKGCQKKLISGFEFDLQSVKSIEQIITPEYVYDLEIEDNHKFFANYVLVHNTDSVALLLNKKSKQETLKFLEELNKNLPGIMELELEDFYKRAIFVSKRSSESGAKKKYALITEHGKVKIRGFETVRRDWCPLARELQSKVLELILKEGNERAALELVKKTIKDLKERRVTREQIMIKTQLKKPISEYKSITPHVIAATKMKEAGFPIDIGMLLEYFIAETREKKTLVREKVKLSNEKGEYNLKYYLEHQIIPAVENIIEVFGVSVKDISDGSSQKKLFS